MTYMRSLSKFPFVSLLPKAFGAPVFCLTASIALLAPPAPAQAVPAPYQALYTQIQTDLNTFDQTLKTSWNGVVAPVTYAPQLLAASSENETNVLGVGYIQSVWAEMTQLQALGIKGVTVKINFPALYAPYYSNATEYQQMLSFYEQVSSEAHARGLKVIVETQVDEPNPASGSGLNPYVHSLSWTAYQTGRAQNAAVIAQYVKPDYLSVLTEPDTETAMSGQANVDTVSGSVQMLTQILAAVKAVNSTGIQVGAGTGTWQKSFTSFINAYAALPMQYIDIHVYPINGAFLQNAITAATTAHAAGKSIAMSEAWLEKILDSELATLSQGTVQSRNNWSFWTPLDTQFLTTLTTLANYEKFDFVSPFWVNFFYSYLNYSASNSSSVPAALQASVAAMDEGLFTTTAVAWENSILVAPDATAPRVPGVPETSTGSLGVTVSWLATTDNVGVGGYTIYRNGKALGATAALSFTDFTAKFGVPYAYTVAAYDAVGNTSPTSAAVQASRR
jgi:hypothetical protein